MGSQKKAVVLMAALAGGIAMATANELLRNWFNDPYFQVRDGISQCPRPRGPLLTEAQMKNESHSRAERGTSCWLAGECRESNAYRYDAAIAQEIARRFEENAGFRNASVWITVKRRFVWAEGCVADGSDAGRLEALLLTVPDVERVFVDVMTGTTGKPPYALGDEQRK
jgi:hypothetical protein